MDLSLRRTTRYFQKFRMGGNEAVYWGRSFRNFSFASGSMRHPIGLMRPLKMAAQISEGGLCFQTRVRPGTHSELNHADDSASRGGSTRAATKCKKCLHADVQHMKDFGSYSGKPLQPLAVKHGFRLLPGVRKVEPCALSSFLRLYSVWLSDRPLSVNLRPRMLSPTNCKSRHKPWFSM